jgi:proliferating cell nuclear antigen
MRLKTVQASAFKASFEVLKDILNDVNMYFDSTGIKILTLDTARAALVDFQLKADNFEEYECPQDRIVAGINITNTFKLLKTISNNDVLTMDIKDRDSLHIKIENPEKKTNTTFRLKLLEIDEDIIEVPQITMAVKTVIPSIDFQRICRDMNNLATEVKIGRVGNKLFIKCAGDFADQETVIECNDQERFEGNLSGIYSLKYLNMFTKATGMCASVQLMQEEQNRFLTLQYNVANLGELKFYLATKVPEE